MSTQLETGAAQTRPRYRALVLGPFALQRDGERIDAGRWQHRVQTLFLLLMTAPDRQRRRDDLMDMLWPEADPESAAGNLRILVHRLRLALGGDPSPVLSDRGWVRLNPDYDWMLDADELESQVREANGDAHRLRAALTLYRGEPLIEHRYEDWAVPVAERALRIWRDACLQLAAIEVAHGDYDDAAQWYRRLLEVDPVDEEAARGLLTALGGADRPGEALRYFDQFKHRLESEIGAPPSQETAALVERLRLQASDRAADVSRLAPAPGFFSHRPDGPLVDRAAELEHALLAAEVVAAGTGRLVLLAGEAGIGKTRVAQEMLLRLQDQGFAVAATRCMERDQAVSFAPFLDVMTMVFAALSSRLRADAASRWPELVWLLPDGLARATVDVPEEPDQQRALFRACLGLLGVAGEERPLAIMLDDLQWADEGSLDLLSYLADQTRGIRCFILAAYRDSDISAEHPLRKTVRRLLRERLADRLTLTRLTPEQTAALVVQIMAGSAPPAEFTDFVYRRTKGNPFFIRRLLETLGGRYRLVRQIAAGGMGRVFEAVDTVTGNRVAAKIMFARAEADPRSLLRFRQEGGLLASLHHPNIVRVHTTVVEEYASCIVMDLVEGRSLADIVAGERLSPARVKHIAAQIASALAAAHERGIVHRDIKPSNIMIGTDDHVTVTDFGIARLIRPSETAVTSTMTGTGMTLGTPLYMAPEQIQGEKVDGRADVYSLGAVLYHLVTGRPPFDDRDPVTIAYKHVHEPPPPPRAIRPDVPEDWEALVLRALAKAPDDRFQTAVAMAQAISELSVPAPKEEARDRTAGDIEHTAVPAPAPRPGFSARTAAGAFAAVLVVLLVAAGIARHAAGSGAGGGSPGTGPGQFSRPTGIQVDDAGNVYVVDEWNARVEEFDRVGTFVRQWGGTGSPLFRDPSDIARDPDTGVLYVSDFGSKRIVVIPPRGKTSVIPLNAGALAVGPNGTLFASNYGDHLIHRFARNGRELAPLSIPMVDVGSFNYPAGMAVDGLGRLYIADRLHDRIVRLSPDGSWSSIVGSGEGSKDGQLKFATDVALDTTLSPVGNIYVADTGNNRIQKFTPQGGFSESRHLGGSPIHGLNHPSSIAVDWQGDLYVSDYDHSRVIKLSAAGEPLWYTHGEKSVVLR